jgi:hypothetical protein
MRTQQHVYAAAVFPSRTTIAGVRLLPLTIGHVLLLHALESPFVVPKGASKARRGDLALALLVLSRPAAKAAQLVDSWRGVLLLHWLSWRVTLAPFFIPARLELAKWLASQTTGPMVWMPESGGRSLNAPLWLQVQSTLMGCLGKSEAEALATPVTVALWQFSAWWELNERVEFASDAEVEIRARQN